MRESGGSRRERRIRWRDREKGERREMKREGVENQ